MNPARPAPGTVLCRVDDLPDPGAKTLYYEAWPAMFLGFVVRKDGGVYGYVDLCPHAGRPLAPMEDRYLTGQKDFLMCSAHGAFFRIEDGFCVSGPCAGERLIPWPVTVDGDVIRAA